MVGNRQNRARVYQHFVGKLIDLLKYFVQIQRMILPWKYNSAFGTYDSVFTPVTSNAIDSETLLRLRKKFGKTLPDGTALPELIDEDEPGVANMRGHILLGTIISFKLKVNWKTNGDNGNGDNSEKKLKTLFHILKKYGTEVQIQMGNDHIDLNYLRSGDKKAKDVYNAFVMWPAHSADDMLIDAKIDFGMMVLGNTPVIRGKGECPICFVESDDLLQTDCGHHFHDACLSRWIKDNPSCPYCRMSI